MNAPHRRTLRRAKPQPRREGMVLVITLMIITVATATAVYAMQGSAVEIQASHAYKRRVMARYATESLVMAAATQIDEVGFCQAGLGSFVPDMGRYRLPTPAATTPSLAGGISIQDFGTANTLQNPLPADCELRSPIPATPYAAGNCATPSYAFFPYFAGVKERWPRWTSSGGGGTPFRCAITVFGELDMGRNSTELAHLDPDWPTVGEPVQGTDVRAYHDMIGMSQAYYDFNQ